MKKQLILIANSDPRCTIVGGVGTYTYHLANQLNKKYAVKYIGKCQEGKPGLVDFEVEVVTENPSDSNITFLRGLAKTKKWMSIDEDAIIHAQRPDWLLPFKKHQGLKVVTLHGSHYKNIKSKKGPLWAFLYKQLERKGIKHADVVIAVDHETRKEYQGWYPKYAQKIVYHPVGVDTSVFVHAQKATARKRAKVGLDKKVFLFVGRLSKEKRVHEMINNLQADEQLIIVGEGELRPYLEKLAVGKNVIFVGRKSQEELVHYYNAANALLLFSTHEGLPTVVLEALSCGLPVLSTPVGEVPNIIKNGYNGYVGTDYRSLMDKEIKREMNVNCVKSVKKYDWKEVAKELDKEVYS